MKGQHNGKPKPVKVSPEQIAMVLQAVAFVECWDAEHPSISSGEDGWAFVTVNGIRMPRPSDELMEALKGLA